MNIKRISIVTVAVLFIGALAWIMSDFLSDDGVSDLGGFDTPVEEVAETSARRRGGRSDLEQDAVNAQGNSIPEGSETDEEAENLEMLRVLVLDIDKNPVTNARVDLREAQPEQRGGRGRMTSFFGGSNVTPSIGHADTDAFGIAVLDATTARRFRLEARTTTSFGGLNVNDEANEADTNPEADHVLVIRPIRIVVATVKTESGKIGGDLLISLEPDSSGSQGSSRERQFRNGFSRITAWSDNKTGQAIFEITHESSGFDDVSKVGVSPRLFGIEGKKVQVDLQPQGLTEVSLTVPDTITVALSLKSAQGDLVTDPTQTSWTVKLPDEEAAAEDTDAIRRAFGRAFGQNLMGSRTIEDGQARIGGFVPLSEVTFNATPKHRLSGTTTASLPADTSEHAVLLELGDIRPALVLHIKEVDGSPAARMSFSVEVNDDNKIEEEEEGFNSRNFMSRIQRRMNGTQRLRTDQQGKLVVDAIAGTTGSVHVKDAESFRGWGGDTSPLLAEVLFENLKAGEQRDMGDITLDRGPLLVSGKVINSAGEPVAGVRLSVTVTEETTQSTEEQRGRGGFGRRGGNGSTRLSVRTKKDGTFLAHRLVDLLAVGRLSLSDRKWTMKDQSFNPGDENLLITVIGGGKLVGRATKSDPSLIGSLSISATLADDPSEPEGRRSRRGRPRGMARTKPDGTYTVENLAPGTYNLRITMNSMEAFSQDGLRVYEGQETTVPPVVVGDGFLMGEVLVVDAEGQPLKDARVSISTGSNEGNRRSSRDWGRSSTRTNEQGSALALIPSGPKFTVSVSSGRLRLSKTVRSSSFPLRLNMKDASQSDSRRRERSGAANDALRDTQRRAGRGGRGGRGGDR